MALRKTSLPNTEPVTLADAKLHLRIDHPDEDARINQLLRAARESAEHRMRRTILPTGWTLTLDEFPAAIRLPMPRALSVDQVRFRDAAGAWQVLSPLAYVLDNSGEYASWLTPAATFSWPDVMPGSINSVEVTYTAGWPNATAVPESIKQWILLALGTWYANREAVATGRANFAELPAQWNEGLLDPFKVVGYY